MYIITCDCINSTSPLAICLCNDLWDIINVGGSSNSDCRPDKTTGLTRSLYNKRTVNCRRETIDLSLSRLQNRMRIHVDIQQYTG